MPSPQPVGLRSQRPLKDSVEPRRPETEIKTLLVLTGAVWMGQGLTLIQGSSMTGSTFWAVTGAICFVAGLVVLGWPWHRSSASS